MLKGKDGGMDVTDGMFLGWGESTCAGEGTYALWRYRCHVSHVVPKTSPFNLSAHHHSSHQDICVDVVSDCVDRVIWIREREAAVNACFTLL